MTHEMLSRMLHFTVCAWIFYEHYPVENRCTSVLSVLRKHRSVEVKLFNICEKITPKWKFCHRLLTLCCLKALEMFVEHKISQARCIFPYYKSNWGCQAPKCHFLWKIKCKTYSMKTDKKIKSRWWLMRNFHFCLSYQKQNWTLSKSKSEVNL